MHNHYTGPKLVFIFSRFTVPKNNISLQYRKKKTHFITQKVFEDTVHYYEFCFNIKFIPKSLCFNQNLKSNNLSSATTCNNSITVKIFKTGIWKWALKNDTCNSLLLLWQNSLNTKHKMWFSLGDGFIRDRH